MLLSSCSDCCELYVFVQDRPSLIKAYFVSCLSSLVLSVALDKRDFFHNSLHIRLT